MLNRLRRGLVVHAPELLRFPARLMPFALQQALMERLLHLVFKEALADGDFAFLEEKWLKIAISDLGQFSVSALDKLDFQQKSSKQNVLRSSLTV